MAKPLLMFTWNEVRDALESVASTPRQRGSVCWLLERLKVDSETMSSDALLVELLSTAQLLGELREHTEARRSLFEG